MLTFLYAILGAAAGLAFSVWMGIMVTGDRSKKSS
jgi:hypothetical protein